jgi:N,N'-diacetyllegionaminate synthase
VKFQTFRAEDVVAPTAPQAAYQQRNTGRRESQLEMIRRLQLDEAAHWTIKKRCEERGIMFLSTPFDHGSADLLARMGVLAFKVASGELTNHPLIAHIASKGKPMLMSTGMSSQREVAAALDIVKANGNVPVTLFHCVSNYPAAPEDCNLSAMASMRSAFGVPVGWSDHTLGINIAVAAAALGADLIEKHFTLDRTMPGPDHLASLEPHELGEMIRAVADVRRAIGSGQKLARASEEGTASVARRSLFTARDLRKGACIAAADLKAVRPGTGIPPNELSTVVGRRLVRDLPTGTLLGKGDIE